MPNDVDGDLMKKCSAPTLVMAAEKDCLFPGKGVIRRAKEIIPNCTTYLLEGRGHMNIIIQLIQVSLRIRRNDNREIIHQACFLSIASKTSFMGFPCLASAWS